MTHALTVISTAIRQLDGLYSLNDLHKAAGAEKKHQPHEFMRLDQTKALIDEIHSGDSRSAHKTINGGPNRGTYVCRELVYAYAMWINAKFNLAVIRAFDSQCERAAQQAAAQIALPLATRAGITPNLRQRINRKAHAVALAQYDTIHAIITNAVRDNLACGATEEKCEGYIDTYGELSSGVALCNVRDLQELVHGVGQVIDAAGSAIATIKRIEKRSGFQLYARLKRHDWEDPDFHKHDRLVQEVIDRISGDDA